MKPELSDRTGVFRDRAHAGEVLAALLEEHAEREGLVLAIPAGGVPVGLALARRLGLPCDVCIVSKITLPWNSEVGYGAVAFDGTWALNEPLVRAIGLTRAQVEQGLARTREKVAQRMARLRGSAPYRPLTGHTAILVDDGLASGWTMSVAIEAVRRLDPSRVVVAVPTAHPDALARVAGAVDRIYCANLRRGRSFAVADAYQEWHDLTEEELMALLQP